ncbi:hypothetical protein F5B22DRAFT_633194 [Xylaria bambusicola]|uniref:uncharacterized protein n=1 Tax=Xylaria bambusicola TaxID=326684 RepID=UPI0020073384|nr:uncharacterized protein F5B22DRAFT_633194 [Xylaria bambusicola]KAI0525778.1 hypothetical protein F5B22DRAFT_633194 [Xylaria bambusicola]
MAHLTSVPLEVLLQITSYLTTPEFGSLRSTCKPLEAALRRDFAREYFSKRQFALIEFSIQALVDISKSQFGPSLKHVIISLEHPLAISTHGPSEEAAVRHNQYHAEYLNHWEFTSTGLDVEMLSEAFKHLPNLESPTVGIRDFPSSSRHRDETTWKSYGCPTFERKTRKKLGLPGNTPDSRGAEYTRHVFLTLLRAMANGAVSGWNPNLTRMEILLHNCRLLDQSFKIPKRLDVGVSLALGKLKTLWLDNLAEDAPLYVQATDDQLEPITAGGFFLSRFLLKTPALEHLRLNFQSYLPGSVEKFLSWVANANENSKSSNSRPTADSLPLHFPCAPEFPKLKVIEIGMATVKATVLFTLYERFKSTLEGVGLHKTMILVPKGTKANYWARLCNTMAKADLQLKMVLLSYLRQSNGTRSALVTFNGSKRQYVKIWKGTAFAQSAKDIISDMELNWPNGSNDKDSDSDSDSDDDDEDEIMDDAL